MAVGYADTVGVAMLNNTLGVNAVMIRDAAVAAQKLWSIITSLGADQTSQIAALAAMNGWKDPANDPAAFWAKANAEFALSQFYYGTLVNPTQFNYDDSLKGVRGGQ